MDTSCLEGNSGAFSGELNLEKLYDFAYGGDMIFRQILCYADVWDNLEDLDQGTYIIFIKSSCEYFGTAGDRI